MNPTPYIGLGASGDTARVGWPESALVQEKIGAWYDAPDLAAEAAVIAGSRPATENGARIPPAIARTVTRPATAWRHGTPRVALGTTS